MSNWTDAELNPYVSNSLKVCATSAPCSIALVGIQPQLRQIPPRRSRSTSATFNPNWAARIAAT
eukprot:gene25008-30012_t